MISLRVVMVAAALSALAVVLDSWRVQKLSFLVWRLEGSCTAVESVAEAFVCGLGRSWWSMDEEGRRHVQAKIYTVKKKNQLLQSIFSLLFRSD